MARIYCYFTLAIVFLLTDTKGNVIRLGTLTNGNRLTLHDNGEVGQVLQNSYLTEENDAGEEDDAFIQLEDGFGFLLQDKESSGFRNLQHHSHLTPIRHFARHGLCRNRKGKARFYMALKSKLCSTQGAFIFQLVEDLCADCKGEWEISKKDECGKNLYFWVSELFDLNGDKYIDHYERHIYDQQTYD